MDKITVTQPTQSTTTTPAAPSRQSEEQSQDSRKAEEVVEREKRPSLSSSGRILDSGSNKYVITSLLGHGSSAHVFLAHKVSSNFPTDELEKREAENDPSGEKEPKDPNNACSEMEGEPVAVKIFNSDFLNRSIQHRETFANELDALINLDHDNIANVLDFGVDGTISSQNSGSSHRGVWFMVLEYAPCGSLLELIEQEKKLQEGHCRLIFSQLVGALAYMTAERYAHLDIKLDNILLADDGRTIKLSDFGFSVYTETPDKLQTQFKGTPGFMAPEMLAGRPYHCEPVDVFQSGLLLFILLIGELPFENAISTDYHFKQILRNDAKGFWSKFDRTNRVSKSCKRLIWSMMAAEPSERPSFDEIQRHEWLDHGKDTVLQKVCGEEYLDLSEAVTRISSLDSSKSQFKKEELDALDADLLNE